MQRSKGAFSIHLLRPGHLDTNGVALALTVKGSGRKCLPGFRVQPAIDNDKLHAAAEQRWSDMRS
jgi:hypothetical protein